MPFDLVRPIVRHHVFFEVILHCLDFMRLLPRDAAPEHEASRAQQEARSTNRESIEESSRHYPHFLLELDTRGYWQHALIIVWRWIRVSSLAFAVARGDHAQPLKLNPALAVATAIDS